MDNDAFCLKQLSSPNKAEARGWLAADVSRNLGEHEPAESVAIVEDLYRRGAIEVTAVDIEDGLDAETADALVVVLPTDPALRAQVFAFQDDYESEFDPTPDEGQKYLFLYKFKGRFESDDA